MPRRTVFDISSFPNSTYLSRAGWLSMQLQLLSITEGNWSVPPISVTCHLGEQLLWKTQPCECCPGSSLLLVVSLNPPLTWRQTPLLASARPSKLSQLVQHSLKLNYLFFFFFKYFVILFICFSVHHPCSPVLGTSSVPMDNPMTASPIRNKHFTLWVLEL